MMEDTNDLSGQSNDGNFGSMPALNSEIKYKILLYQDWVFSN
jgi:hypothetical protein